MDFNLTTRGLDCSTVQQTISECNDKIILANQKLMLVFCGYIILLAIVLIYYEIKIKRLKNGMGSNTDQKVN